MLNGFECIGTAAGIVGAVMIASNTRYSKYGWVGFSVSSLSLAVFAVQIQAWGLLLLQICFCCTNALGLYRWLLLPMLRGSGIIRTGQS